MTSAFHIQQERNERGGALIARDQEQRVRAKLRFTDAGPNHRIVDQTELDRAATRSCANEILASALVNDARWDQVMLIPLCPVFLATAIRHPEWHDTVHMPPVFLSTAGDLQ